MWKSTANTPILARPRSWDSVLLQFVYFGVISSRTTALQQTNLKCAYCTLMQMVFIVLEAIEMGCLSVIKSFLHVVCVWQAEGTVVTAAD